MSIETADRRSTQIPNERQVGWFNDTLQTWECSHCPASFQVHQNLELHYAINHAAFTDNRQLTTDNSDEFDQTRQHAHIPASLCPVKDCKEWPTVANARYVSGHLALGPTPAANCQNCGFGGGTHTEWCADKPGPINARTIENQFGESVPPSAMGTPRHVSPAINEFRIFELETQLKAKSDLLDIERGKNALLLQRIEGFERMNERLSNAVDEWLANATPEHKADA